VSKRPILNAWRGWTLAVVGALLSASACTEAGGETVDPYGRCPTAWRTYPFQPAGSDIRFPADEGAHYVSDINVTMEWWYTIYHLTTPEGRKFSIMSTFFMPQADISYRPFNVSDVTAGEMHDSGEWGELRAGEGRLDLTWIPTNPSEPASYLRHRSDGDGQSVPFAYDQYLHYVHPREATRSYELRLTVDALKPPFLVGGDGYVTIGDCGDSYYYSLTHLEASGELTLAGETFQVSGRGWMDHQWGPFMLSPLPGSKNNYEWMALHLDNGDEYMVSVIFDQQNQTHQEPGFGSIGWMNADCTQDYTLDYGVERLAYWLQPESGDYYSHLWRITVPEKQLDVVVTPVIEDQTVKFVSTAFYEGRSTVEGTAGGSPVTGLAFAELVHHYVPPVITVLTPDATEIPAGSTEVTWRVENPDDGLPLGFTVSALSGGDTTVVCPPTADPSCTADLSDLSGPVTLIVTGASVDGIVSGAGQRSVTVTP
jgi:predicted secreted hydrolase